MPEFFSVLPPDEALQRLWQHLPPLTQTEDVDLLEAVGRVTAQPLRAPEAMPAFTRAMMDGYALRAADTFGATQAAPAFLSVVGEVPMGQAAGLALRPGQAALVQTGGMLPEGADAVVRLEVTQATRASEIEIFTPAAPGENVVRAGEEVEANAEVLPAGHRLRPQDVGALAALGLLRITVAPRPRVAVLATGDEIVPPEAQPRPGQVRDADSAMLLGQIGQAGGAGKSYGIVPDRYGDLLAAAQAALTEAEALVISAGSSVSARDLTAKVAAALGEPGVLVHGVAVRPGKPTLLAVAGGKPVFGLPGNPVAAMVMADLFVVPTLYRLQGCAEPPPRPMVRATLSHPLRSQTGRVDYVPARLRYNAGPDLPAAEPVFGKPNQVLTLAQADGLIVVPMDATGVAAGEVVAVRLF